MTLQSHRLHLVLLLAAGLALGYGSPFRGVPEAAAADVVRDSALGARLEEPISAGDVHAFRVPLLAGTAIRVRLASEGVSSDKGGDSGPKPELVALDPSLAEIGRISADASDLQLVVPSAGTYRFEVRAGSYSGEYEIRIDGEGPVAPPANSRSVFDVSGAPVVRHVDAAAGSWVDLEVRRRSGGVPSVDSVADASGQPLSLVVKSVRSDRVRLESIPVAVSGGLDVTVSAAGGSGTYELRAKVRASSDRPSGGDSFDSNRVLVQLAAGVDAVAFGAQRGWTLLELEGNLALYSTPAARAGHESEDADDADSSPDVLTATPDVIARLPEGSQANLPAVGSDYGRTDVEKQTAMAQIRAIGPRTGATGANVVVAVLDGGVEASHPFLAGRVLPGYDFVDRDADASETKNGLDDDGDQLIDEGYGHGTFVSSLVLAVAPGSKILPVRVLDTDGRGRVSDIAAGIYWALDHGANVLNLSFGTVGGNATLAAAVRTALGRGVVVVASTGNSAGAAGLDFPAAMPGVIAVSALDAAGQRATFANAGAGTTIAAPGVDVIGAFPEGLSAKWSGTSFAAAFVTGGAALVIETAPGSTPARVALLISRRARPLGAAVPRVDRRALGAGLLDLSRFVR
jgi:subtilisin family serine protease